MSSASDRSNILTVGEHSEQYVKKTTFLTFESKPEMKLLLCASFPEAIEILMIFEHSTAQHVNNTFMLKTGNQNVLTSRQQGELTCSFKPSLSLAALSLAMTTSASCTTCIG